MTSSHSGLLFFATLYIGLYTSAGLNKIWFIYIMYIHLYSPQR